MPSEPKATLIRDESTPEKREWWAAVLRAAKTAPTLGCSEGTMSEDTIDNAMREAFERGRAQGWREACEEIEARFASLGTSEANLAVLALRGLAARRPKEGEK